MTIEADGAASGKRNTAMSGECLLQGTVMLAQPDTEKYVYTVSLVPFNGSANSCLWDSKTPYNAYAAVSFVNVGSAMNPVYRRALTLLMDNGHTSYVAGDLVKS